MTNFFNKIKDALSNITSMFANKYDEKEKEAHKKLVYLFETKKRPLDNDDIAAIEDDLCTITEDGGRPVIKKTCKEIKRVLAKRKRRTEFMTSDAEYKKFIKKEFKRVYDLSSDKCKRLKKITKPKKKYTPKYKNDIQCVVLPQWWDMSNPEHRRLAKELPLNEILDKIDQIQDSDVPAEEEAEWFSEENVKRLEEYYNKRTPKPCSLENGCEKCMKYAMNKKLEEMEMAEYKNRAKTRKFLNEVTIDRWLSTVPNSKMIIDRVYSYEEKLWLAYLFYNDFDFYDLSDVDKGVFLNILKQKEIINFQAIVNNEKTEETEKLKNMHEKKELFNLKDKVDIYINSDVYQSDVDIEEKKKIMKEIRRKGHRPLLKTNCFEFPHLVYVFKKDAEHAPQVFRPGRIASTTFYKRHPRFKKNKFGIALDDLTEFDQDICAVQRDKVYDEEFENWKQETIIRQEQIKREVNKRINEELKEYNLSLGNELSDEEEREAETAYYKLLKKRYVEEVEMINNFISNPEYFRDCIPDKACTLALNVDNEINTKIWKRCKEFEKMNIAIGNVKNSKRVEDMSPSELLDHVRDGLDVEFKDKWYQNRNYPQQWERDASIERRVLDIENMKSDNDTKVISSSMFTTNYCITGNEQNNVILNDVTFENNHSKAIDSNRINQDSEGNADARVTNGDSFASNSANSNNPAVGNVNDGSNIINTVNSNTDIANNGNACINVPTTVGTNNVVESDQNAQVTEVEDETPEERRKYLIALEERIKAYKIRRKEKLRKIAAGEIPDDRKKKPVAPPKEIVYDENGRATTGCLPPQSEKRLRRFKEDGYAVDDPRYGPSDEVIKKIPLTAVANTDELLAQKDWRERLAEKEAKLGLKLNDTIHRPVELESVVTRIDPNSKEEMSESMKAIYKGRYAKKTMHFENEQNEESQYDDKPKQFKMQSHEDLSTPLMPQTNTNGAKRHFVEDRQANISGDVPSGNNTQQQPANPVFDNMSQQPANPVFNNTQQQSANQMFGNMSQQPANPVFNNTQQPPANPVFNNMSQQSANPVFGNMQQQPPANPVFNNMSQPPVNMSSNNTAQTYVHPLLDGLNAFKSNTSQAFNQSSLSTNTQTSPLQTSSPTFEWSTLRRRVPSRPLLVNPAVTEQVMAKYDSKPFEELWKLPELPPAPPVDPEFEKNIFNIETSPERKEELRKMQAPPGEPKEDYSHMYRTKEEPNEGNWFL